MRRSRLTRSATVLVLLLATAGPWMAMEAQELSLKDQVIERVLDNGLTVLTAVRSDVPIVSVWTWYAVGGRDERKGEAGLAHFLEHMMFKGSERFEKGEIDRITQKQGGANNAFTSCDATAYYFDLPAAGLGAALEIEADRLVKVQFFPMRLGSNLWRQYIIKFDGEANEVVIVLRA